MGSMVQVFTPYTEEVMLWSVASSALYAMHSLFGIMSMSGLGGGCSAEQDRELLSQSRSWLFPLCQSGPVRQG